LETAALPTELHSYEPNSLLSHGVMSTIGVNLALFF